MIRQANQIVDADLIELRQPDGIFQRQRTFAALIFGVQGLVAEQIFCHLPLCQVAVFPQITDSKFHNITRRPSYLRTMRPIDFLDNMSYNY